MSRLKARGNVFMLVYERLVNNEKNAITLRTLTHNLINEEEYIKTIYYGVDEKLYFLNHIISNLSRGYSKDRIYKIDLSILLVASYEILYLSDIPDKVSINEALELAKTYSTKKSISFINGILASIVKDKENIIESESDFSIEKAKIEEEKWLQEAEERRLKNRKIEHISYNNQQDNNGDFEQNGYDEEFSHEYMENSDDEEDAINEDKELIIDQDINDIILEDDEDNE